jgi:tetratricopeptide (TPR) repeat protein
MGDPAEEEAMQTAEAILEQARHLLGQRQAGQAERLAQRALELAPSHPQAWRLLAEARQAQGRHDEAMAAWKHLERLTPADPEASFAVAVAVLEAGRADEALARLETLLRRWPGHAGALLQLSSTQSAGRLRLFSPGT